MTSEKGYFQTKRTELKEGSFVFFIGRGFIIAAILIISSLSFALGYFVGKSVQSPVESRTSVITQENLRNKNVPPPKADIDKRSFLTTPDEKEAVAQQPEQTKGTQETQRTKETPETRETTKVRKYTVQVGAFKNASDADALKAKLDKKGYKTYMTRSETKKHENLYKVRIGEFDTRKEAEVLSIKIRNSDGLQTFVILK
ncbi:MAG: SPOR domain-containing protein [Nitrospirota bacterium]